MKILTLLALAVALFGCDSTSGPVTGAGDILVPLSFGNTWTYKSTNYDSAGVVQTESTFERKINDTITSYGEVLSSIGLTNMTNRSDGYYEGFYVEPLKLVAKYPAAAGQHYSKDTVRYAYFPESPGPDFGYGEYEVISTSETVFTDLHGFKTYHYQIVYHSSTDGKPLERYDRYYAPGIGLVRELVYGYRQSGELWLAGRMDLVSYTLQE